MEYRPRLTEIEWAIMEVLKDGDGHERGELLACIGDDQADLGALNTHLANIRRKIEPFEETIVCQVKGKFLWLHRWVKKLSYSSDNLVEKFQPPLKFRKKDRTSKPIL